MKKLSGTCWLTLLFVAACSEWSGAEYCKKLRPVQKHREVWKNRSVPRTRKNWWGQYSTGWEIERYKTTELYWDFEYQMECCNGYERDSHHNCNPVCQQSCATNSYCAAPDHCDCVDGYQLNESDGTCGPHCVNGCADNSECIAPSVCSCLDGYREANNGWRKICETVCETNPCTANSHCAAPERCECDLGYELANSNNGSNCQPVCYTPCSENSFCAQPDICECKNGYEPGDFLSGEQQKCKPVCEGGCAANRRCIAPNVCACDEGFESSQEDEHGVCTPICQHGCGVHSHCESPDNCECDVGYIIRSCIDGRCECTPKCANDCPAYSICTAPNVCECLPGYAKHQASEASEGSCVPVCENGCLNGYCHEPNRCVCQPGFLKGPDDRCEPVCHLGCFNGHCTAPGTCTCNVGYHFEKGSILKCEPICSEPCVNGDCVAPDTCICWQDHEPQADRGEIPFNSHVCKPTCEPQCLNATCTSPHSCSCLPDYEPVSAENVTACKPKCRGCTMGDCIAPNNCQCWPGFVFDGAQCSWVPTTITQISTRIMDNSTAQVITETSSSNPPLPATNCSALCDCWQRSDGHPDEVPDLLNCARVCVDAHDLPCLELSHCRCDAESLDLVCDDQEKREYDDEQGVLYYKCHVKRLKPTSRPEQSSKERMQGVHNGSNNNSRVWHVLAWTASIGIIAVSCVLIGLRYAQRRRYSINRDEPEFENEAYEDDI